MVNAWPQIPAMKPILRQNAPSIRIIRVCVNGIQSVEACEGDLVCFKGKCKEKSNDDGKPVLEEEVVTDDSDVLGDAIPLPTDSGNPLSKDDPCSQCTFRERCAKENSSDKVRQTSISNWSQVLMKPKL